MQVLVWIVAIMEANNQPGRQQYLIKLAKIQIRLKHETDAEATLDRVSELLNPDDQ